MAPSIVLTADTFIDPLGDDRPRTVTANSNVNSNNASNICVGSRLRAKRTSLGISEKELGDELGIDPKDVHTYEEGVKRINANLLFRVAKLLDVRLDYFFRGYTTEELGKCLKSSP
jgi:ribosome-binding protein aMBF1 (putative translation factor)